MHLGAFSVSLAVKCPIPDIYIDERRPGPALESAQKVQDDAKFFAGHANEQGASGLICGGWQRNRKHSSETVFWQGGIQRTWPRSIRRSGTNLTPEKKH